VTTKKNECGQGAKRSTYADRKIDSNKNFIYVKERSLYSIPLMILKPAKKIEIRSGLNMSICSETCVSLNTVINSFNNLI